MQKKFLSAKLCLIKHAKKPPKEYVWMYKSFSKKVKFLRVDEKVYLYVSLALFFALCSYMGGTEVPADWRGALNLTYRYGGSLINSARYV